MLFRSVAVDGAPAGVSAAVTNLSTTGGTTTGTVTVTVGAAVVPGTFAITVRASGSGVTDVTSALSLIVTAAPAIAVTLTTSPVSIGQGLSGTVQVAIAPTNFTGCVTLALEGIRSDRGSPSCCTSTRKTPGNTRSRKATS